ncbi:MAG: DUF2892 domain-containing protein [Bacteroidia bacterium]
MKKNMGVADRVLRVLAAIVVIASYFMGFISGTLAIVLLIFSAIFILTSVLGFCPLYLPLGLSTLKKSEK